MSKPAPATILLAGRDGEIQQILRDDLQLVPFRVPAPSIGALVDLASLGKVLDAFRRLREGDTLAGVELFPADGRSPVCLSAARCEDGFALVFAPSRAELDAWVHELASGRGPLARAASAMEALSPTPGAGVEDGDVVGELSELLRDSTDLQRALHRRGEELARAVAERDRAIGIVAHDLRNPLAAIRNYITLLQEESEPLGEDGRGYLRRLDRVSLRMQRLVEDLLDLSRSDWGHLKLEPTRFDLRETVREVVRDLAALARRREIELDLLPGPPEARVRADPRRIEQVVFNLVENAIRYSPSGSRISVAVALTQSEVTVSVEDQGPGIAAHEIPRLFRPFSCASSQPFDGAPATGLGLAICKRILDAHGGRVWVESELGQGSVFAMAVPIHGPGGRTGAGAGDAGEAADDPER